MDYDNFGKPQTPVNNTIELGDEFFDHDDSYRPAIPEGRWTFKVDAPPTMFFAVNTDAVMLEWSVTCLEGPGAGETLKHRTMYGRKIGPNRVGKTEEGARTRAFLRTIGLVKQEGVPLRLDADTVNNRMFQGEVIWNKSKTGDGTFANIDKVYPMDEPGQRFEGEVPKTGGSAMNDLPF